ncbi:MAG: hypothetical protein ACP6IQ_02300 [Candidatus Njordarchaeia archaeon]
MANVFQQHDVDFNAGIMTKLPQSTAAEDAWGRNALQTITIARRYPRNPQQAIGYRGIVDYTTGQQTSEVTLDCILTEQTQPAVEGTGASGTSIYRFAENQMTVGTESYVLTSCNIGFTAGNPATVSYGYITAGEASALERIATAPDVLKDGEEAYFAVVMGDDGSGIELMAKDNSGTWVSGSSHIILPSGVQSLTFNSTINKDNIMDVRAAQPIQFVTTYPIDITVSVETFDKSTGSDGWDAGSLQTLGVKLAGLNNHADRSSYTAPSRTPGVNFPASTAYLVLSMGLVKTDESETLNVGGYLTYTYNYTAADLAIPLLYV